MEGTRPPSHSSGLLLLLCLLVFAVCAGALFARYRLGEVKDLVLRQIAAELGVEARVGAIATSGVRTLRLSDVELSRHAESAPAFSILIPTALVELDVADLASGRVTLERLELYGARATAVRREGETWSPWPGALSLSSGEGLQIVGHNCLVHIVEPAAPKPIRLTGVDFDLFAGGRLQQLSGPVSGRLQGQPAARFAGQFRFASQNDFSVNLRSEPIELSGLSRGPLLPALDAPALTGRIKPRLRLDGYPGGLLVLALEAELAGVAAPSFEQAGPLRGTLALTANYEARNNRLRLESANLDSEQVSAFATGSVDFEQQPAAIELDCRINGAALSSAFIGQALASLPGTEDSKVNLTFLEDPNMRLKVAGNTLGVSAEASLQASGVSVRAQGFQGFPLAVNAQLTGFEASWHTDGQPAGMSATLSGGTIALPSAGIAAEEATGQLSLDNGVLSIASLSLGTGGQRLSGEARWNLETESGGISLAGSIAHVEDTPLASFSPGLDPSGALNVVETSFRKDSEGYHFEGVIDASAAKIGYGRLFRKPAGLGLRAGFSASGSSLAGPLNASLELSSVDTEGSGSLVWADGALASAELEFQRVSLAALGQWIEGPIVPAQGEAREVRAGYDATTKRAKISAKIPEMTCILGLESTILSASEADLDGHIDFGQEQPQGALRLRARQCALPPAGFKWASLAGKGAPVPRGRWDFDLEAEEVSFPPWQARGVKAAAYADGTGVGFGSFTADVEDGSVAGAYHSYHETNSYNLEVAWDNTSGGSLLEHMGAPRVLEGQSDGNVAFSVARDKENSLTGSGSFVVRQGRFSADFLLSQLGAAPGEELTALPPSLRFERLGADLDMRDGVIRTEDVELISEGISVAGGGSFVMGGDLDYEFEVVVDPETAEQMPALRETLNLRGHRIANQDIGLSIHVTGPLREPKGEVRGGPARGTTIVTGTLEVASEVVDIPRKILVDLLKIGGGIVRGPK